MDYYDFHLNNKQDMIFDGKVSLIYSLYDAWFAHLGYRLSRLEIEQDIGASDNMVEHKFVGPFFSLHYYFSG